MRSRAKEIWPFGSECIGRCAYFFFAICYIDRIGHESVTRRRAPISPSKERAQ